MQKPINPYFQGSQAYYWWQQGRDNGDFPQEDDSFAKRKWCEGRMGYAGEIIEGEMMKCSRYYDNGNTVISPEKK